MSPSEAVGVNKLKSEKLDRLIMVQGIDLLSVRELREGDYPFAIATHTTPRIGSYPTAS